MDTPSANLSASPPNAIETTKNFRTPASPPTNVLTPRRSPLRQSALIQKHHFQNRRGCPPSYPRTDQRTSDGRFGSNFHPDIKNCIAMESSRAPASMLL